MDIQFYGANCLVLSDKKTRIVIDDNLSELGATPVTKDGDVCLSTHGYQIAVDKKPKIFIDGPGEYEVNGISIYGRQARAHVDEEGQETATIYKLMIGDTSVMIAGHIFPKLNDAELEAMGMIDILVVPVGGNGYTLDGAGALEVIKAIEPKVVVPTHYADKGLNYPVPQQSLEDALKAIPMEITERTAKLSTKIADQSDISRLIVLEKS